MATLFAQGEMWKETLLYLWGDFQKISRNLQNHMDHELLSNGGGGGGVSE